MLILPCLDEETFCIAQQAFKDRDFTSLIAHMEDHSRIRARERSAAIQAARQERDDTSC